MTGAEIMESVMRDYGIGPRDFFGATRLENVVHARRAAMVLMHEAGIEVSIIARLTKRERTTVLYHIRPELRNRHKVYFAARQAEIIRNRPPREGYMGTRKLSDEQRAALMDVFHAGKQEETFAMERDLGVSRHYTRKLIYMLERQKARRARPAAERTASSPLWARAIQRGAISI